eukprot:1146660-Pelagomonas_calceolata.AAC.4
MAGPKHEWRDWTEWQARNTSGEIGQNGRPETSGVVDQEAHPTRTRENHIGTLRTLPTSDKEKETHWLRRAVSLPHQPCA